MKKYRMLVIVIVALAILAGSLGVTTRPAYAASCTQYYYVRHGQSLSSIAAWYGVKWQYLAQLNDLYENWIGNFRLCPVLTVPADKLDFVAYGSHLDLIVSKIQEKLAGKEEVVFGDEEVERVNGEKR